MRIKIIGGGPAGLLFAMLMKKHDPAHDVTVFEQNAPDATYGWGVVFSDVALGFIRDIDPDFFVEFTRNHARCDRMEVVHRGTAVPIHGNGFSRVARIELLRVLQDNCRRVGWICASGCASPRSRKPDRLTSSSPPTASTARSAKASASISSPRWRPGATGSPGMARRICSTP